MTTIATTWLLLSLFLCAYAWFCYRTAAVLPVIVVAAALAVYIPTGHPRFTAPPAGHYQVVGVDIEVPSATQRGAIRVLLKADGPAVYYTMPYTTGDANSLQDALDVGGEGGVTANVGEGGGVSYDGEPPVTGDENKTAERPMTEVE